MVCDLVCLSLKPNMVSLNPYSIGIWSATIREAIGTTKMECLNPYSIGIWSATRLTQTATCSNLTGLNPYSIGIWSATSFYFERAYHQS